MSAAIDISDTGFDTNGSSTNGSNNKSSKKKGWFDHWWALPLTVLISTFVLMIFFFVLDKFNVWGLRKVRRKQLEKISKAFHKRRKAGRYEEL